MNDKLNLHPYSQWQLLVKDFFESMRLWRFWIHLGWEDVAKQYRRSFLGPVWISINTALFVIVFGLIGAQLFKLPVREYLPYFCLGHVLFSFLASLVNEGCQTYIAADAFLKQTPYPKFAFALRVVWRNVIMLAHNLPVAIGVLIWSNQFGEIRPFLFVTGLVATVCAATLVVAILGVISVRFRDIPMVVASVMQIGFFVTPVMWQTAQLTERAQSLIMLNPLAAFLDLLRAPLMGHAPAQASVVMAACVLVALICLYCAIFVFARRRIAYWI